MLRRQIRRGPRDLARQRAAARREGIALSPAGLRQPPSPAGQNAAPVYRRLARLLKAKPLDPTARSITRDLGVRIAHSPAEVERVRELLARRADVMALVLAATDRPRCDFGRDWSQAPDLVLLPPSSAMRQGLILLSARSYLLAKEKRYPEAIRTQARAFRIAGHAAADSVIFNFIIAAAYARMACDGMENILHVAGADAEVSQSVRRSIEANWPRLGFYEAWKGEAAFNTISMRRLRRGGPRLLIRWTTWPEFDDQGRAVRSKRPVRALSRRDRRTWTRMVDAAEAAYLRQVRQLIALANQPHAVRHALYNQLEYLSGRPSIAERLFGGITDLSHTRLGWTQLRTEARGAVLRAGATLLAHKAQHGAFPERLQQGLPQPPRDPFSGQPLGYRREGEGFVVYSVGPRGDYDGRQTAAGAEEQVRLWYPAPPPRRPRWLGAPADAPEPIQPS
jgi:hypothetical protein